MSREPYQIRVSRRRRRTIMVHREGGRLVAVVPAHLTDQQQAELVGPLVDRFLSKEEAKRAPRGDEALTARAVALYREHIASHAEGPEQALGVRWVTNMDKRWASCTYASGEIRLSARLQTMPGWVVDHVLLHELTHLVEHSHSARFWSILDATPHALQAKGFLMALDHVREQDARGVVGL